MRPTNRLAAALAAIAAATIALGCGDSEQNTYVQEVNELQTQLVNEVTDILADAPGADPRGYRKVAEELRGAFAMKADEFARVEAPDEVSELHSQLVAAVRAVGDEMRSAERGFASGNPREARRAAKELERAGSQLETRLDEVIDQINAELGD